MAVGAHLLGAPSSAQAQTVDAAAAYPTQSVRFIVPATAGGTTDVVIRHIAKYLSEAWNAPVLVENRAGAGGVIGAQYVAAQKPDGYTFLAAPSAFGVRSAIDRNLPFDSLKDFVGVGQMARSPSFMVVSPSLGFKSLKDLIAFAKGKPQGIVYGSAGVGSTAHLHAAAVAHLAGFKADHVAYKGTPEAVNDAMAGRILYAFAPGPNALPLAKEGKLQILATSSIAGTRFMPGVPSLAQAGLGGYESEDWFGVLAPAGTPLPVRQRVAKEMARILALPEVRERFNTLGAEPVASGPVEFESFVREYVLRTRKLAEEIGMKPEG
ncbi:MAG: tripartite tricarboxylate transporter substrate binding protein [Proteobacteria bacterium]|nr:tripartite tricarboxylate transporter substrate binding protein [Burkholderiales bacterium]